MRRAGSRGHGRRAVVTASTGPQLAYLFVGRMDASMARTRTDLSSGAPDTMAGQTYMSRVSTSVIPACWVSMMAWASSSAGGTAPCRARP